MRIGAVRLEGWRARLATRDGDIADGLLEAVAPLHELVDEVAAGRRQLAADHALALEQRLSHLTPLHDEHAGLAHDERRAVVARLRRLAEY